MLFLKCKRLIYSGFYVIINVSSTTALWQLLFLNPQCGFRKALKIHFQRIFKADTFLDVKLIPTYGRTKVQEKFDYF